MDHALWLGSHALDHLLRRFGFHQHGDAMAVIFPPDLGDDEMTRRALHQPHPEPLFQKADAAAQT
ncbi:hypothetical protein D9M72_649660 [compost metagenome]